MEDNYQVDYDDSGYKPIIGTCGTMCPENEIIMRERNRLLHFFEKPTNSSVNVREIAVKEYSRPAAGRDHLKINELRPAAVLKQTCLYLIDQIIPRTDVAWYRVYEFVFNRLRAVRQDVTIQRITGENAIFILEICVRFHIYASYRYATNPDHVFVLLIKKLHNESADNYDNKINDTHLQECLLRLLHLYNECPDESCKNRADFVSLYLLINLADPDALRLGLQMKSLLCEYKSFSIALSISLAWWNSNYIRALRLARSLTYLQSCAIHRHLRAIRSLTLERMNRSHSGKNLVFPLSHLSNLLLLSDDSSHHHHRVTELCTSHGLNIENKNVTFSKTDFKLPTKSFSSNELWIDEKRKASLSDLLSGKT